MWVWSLCEKSYQPVIVSSDMIHCCSGKAFTLLRVVRAPCRTKTTNRSSFNPAGNVISLQILKLETPFLATFISLQEKKGPREEWGLSDSSFCFREVCVNKVISSRTFFYFWAKNICSKSSIFTSAKFRKSGVWSQNGHYYNCSSRKKRNKLSLSWKGDRGQCILVSRFFIYLVVVECSWRISSSYSVFLFFRPSFRLFF